MFCSTPKPSTVFANGYLYCHDSLQMGTKKLSIVTLSLFAAIITSCGHRQSAPKEEEIVQRVEELPEVIPENIEDRLQFIADNKSRMEDTVGVLRMSALKYYYEQHDNTAQWSADGMASDAATQMLSCIERADEAGLLPRQYHLRGLSKAMEQVAADAAARKNAALWAKIDVMMTDAFMKMATHLHYGMGPRDSVTLRKDSLFSDTALTQLLDQALQQHNIPAVLHDLEPKYAGYTALKEGLAAFKQEYAGRTWDTLPQQYTDTLAFKYLLRNRLVQGGYLDTAGRAADTSILKQGVKAFQEAFNMYADGKAGKKTIAMMNRSVADWEAQVAVNFDRWRKLPDSLPSRYIMVNVPAFKLVVLDSGVVALESRVIVGSPRNRTPLLNSVMTNFVLFPYWRVPYSIVFKEMLPAIKRNVGYLASRNLEVIDHHGDAVDPHTIDWSKLDKGHFPYVLRQMDGVENSLGVMKFNFMNAYSVYLHDTNSRGLFKNAYRALSHGCVRVQQWDSLAMYLIRKDTVLHPRDSVRAWLAREEKKQINFSPRIPIYIRYFSVEGIDGSLVFHEDIYGEDRRLLRRMGYK